MATETVVSHHTTTDEQVEEKPNEELKTIQQESVSPPKESGEENAKAEELPSSAAPLSETEEKAEEKLTEPPVLEEVVKTDDTPIVDVPVKENLEVAQDPVCEPDTSTVPKPVVDVVKSKPEEPLEVSPVKEPEAIVVKEREDSEAESTKVEKPEPAVPQVEGKLGEEQSEVTEQVEKICEEVEPKGSVAGETEKVEKSEEPLEVSTIKEPEAIVVKEREDSEAESTKVEKPEPAVPQEEEKLGEEQSEVTEQVEKICEEVDPKGSVAGETEKVEKSEEPLEVSTKICEEVEPKGSVADETVKVEKSEEPLEVSTKICEEVEPKGSVADETVKVEKPEEPLEVSPVKEPEAIIVKEREDLEADSTKVEKPEPTVPQLEEKLGEEQSRVTEQVEKICEEVEPKGSVANETVKVEKPEEPLEVSPVKEPEAMVAKEREDLEDSKKVEKPEPAVPQVEEKLGEEQSGVTEQVEKICEEVEPKGSVAGETAKVEKPEEPLEVEDDNSAISTAEVAEKSFEGQNTSSGVELVAENKKEEDVEDEKPASVKTNNDGDMEGKLDENITVVNKQVGEAQESKLEVKGEETVKDGVDKLEEEKVDKTPKSDVPNLEPSSEVGDDTKLSRDLPKEVPAKPTQKHSNNIITMVKKTLVKAKKAIIGKSPNSKTLSSETKGDIEVK